MNEKDTKKSDSKNINEEEEDQEVVFDACIFNCSYAEQQILEDEKEIEGNMKRNNPNNQRGKQININSPKNRDQRTDVLVSDTLSEDATLSIDDKSLLDYDSSNSWESVKQHG